LNAVLIAVLAAFSWGLSAVFVRVGMRDVSTSAGTLVSLLAGTLFTGALVVLLDFDGLREVSAPTAAMLALIGVLNFPIGRFLNYLGMSRLGVTRSTPLLASSPLFAALIAILFGGEQLELGTAIGGLLILAGFYVTITRPAP
jgi:drug/metabolite transporter (DMT)-like permease